MINPMKQMQRSVYNARLMYGTVIVGVARTMIDTASKGSGTSRRDDGSSKHSNTQEITVKESASQRDPY